MNCKQLAFAAFVVAAQHSKFQPPCGFLKPRTSLLNQLRFCATAEATTIKKYFPRLESGMGSVRRANGRVRLIVKSPHKEAPLRLNGSAPPTNPVG